nr:hypothetical protein [Tanacetum cinerariifolium]
MLSGIIKQAGLWEPKATRMSLELADMSIQCTRGIVENVLIKVGKFVLPIDFVNLDMPEGSRVSIILGRPFLATARAMIDVFNKKITLRVRDDEVIFDMDQSIKRSPAEDYECYGVDDLNDAINAETQELLANDTTDSFLLKGLEKSIEQSDLKSYKCEAIHDSDSIRPIESINKPYPIVLDSALTWWNVYVCSVTLNDAHTTPWNYFKAMFIRKYFPRNEVKQMENKLWNLKLKGTKLTTYNQRFQELILICPEMVPNIDRLLKRYIEGLPLNIKRNVTSSKPVDLHEAIEMAQGLMYQVVQELGENSGNKRKWNKNHYNNNNTNTNNVGNFNPNKHPETRRVFTAEQGTYAGKPPFCKKCGRHHTDQAKEDPKPKEDKVVMLLTSDAVKRAITRTSAQTMETKAVVTRFEVANPSLRMIKDK